MERPDTELAPICAKKLSLCVQCLIITCEIINHQEKFLATKMFHLPPYLAL
jgi:hypothetical protein